MRNVVLCSKLTLLVFARKLKAVSFKLTVDQRFGTISNCTQRMLSVIVNN